jgi:hypothetical protein
MIHGYPECGPGALTMEELYQSFRERLGEESDRYRGALELISKWSNGNLGDIAREALGPDGRPALNGSDAS